MKEAVFYDVLDQMEGIDYDITNGYYPTITDLEEYRVKEDMNLFLPILAYFASDPFKRAGVRAESPNEYMATVKYCKDIISKVKLT